VLAIDDLALSVSVSSDLMSFAPYGRHTLIRYAHPSGQPAAVTPLRCVSLLAQERRAKEGHPDIRVSLRETSLAPAPTYMGSFSQALDPKTIEVVKDAEAPHQCL